MELTDELIQTLPIEELAHTLNTQLEDYKSLQHLCDSLGITYNRVTSRFNKHDYAYVPRHKKYLRVNLSEDTLVLPTQGSTTSSNVLTTEQLELLNYLLPHIDDLKSLINNNANPTALASSLLIDKRILDSTTTSTKNLTVYNDIYLQFTTMCSTQFLQYQTKHLLAQALLEFIDKYATEDIQAKPATSRKKITKKQTKPSTDTLNP